MSEIGDAIANYDMPSRKAILQYLVRMGSFTSAPKILNDDIGDEDVDLPNFRTWDDVRERCSCELKGWPVSIRRFFVSRGESFSERIRVMQWNILAQALADGSDRFVKCPIDALTWQTRRWRLLAEIAEMQPDVLCLQEVDHFRFFQKVLASVGLQGIFYPKPDSPCLYIPNNNGPDGCAMFVNTTRFEILQSISRCLEVWGCQTNQVAILCKLRRRSDDAEFWILTTHLKARTGHFLSAIRKEQGCDLIDFIQKTAGRNAAVIVAGDMNSSQEEALHSVFSSAGLETSYLNQEPSYTTWTIREEGEACKTLDYILYSRQSFCVKSILKIPSESEIGSNRVPSHLYPSDHFALVADISFIAS